MKTTGLESALKGFFSVRFRGVRYFLLSPVPIFVIQTGKRMDKANVIATYAETCGGKQPREKIGILPSFTPTGFPKQIP